MLSVHSLSAGGEARYITYYLGGVAKGVDEYYTEGGGPPGEWVGAGSERLGLEGPLHEEGLRALLGGLDPKTGMALSKSRRDVLAFDLCWSAPKSVTLLFVFGGTDIAHDVSSAHTAAVRAALGYLERTGCRVRRGHGGTRHEVAEGFLGAAFRHRTSRAGDPQLHTHVLVGNVARGPDGRWSALASAYLWRQARTAGYLYQAQLRAELTRRLGVQWGPLRKGAADLEGVPARVLRAFSRRRADIEAELSVTDARSKRGAEVAALRTRPTKDYEADEHELHLEWTQRAERLGVTRDHFVRLLDATERSRDPLSITPAEVTDALTAEDATFDRDDVLRANAIRAPRWALVGEIETLADDLLATPAVVPLEGGRYSTPDMLRLEAAVIEHALRRRDSNVAVAPDALINEEIRRRMLSRGWLRSEQGAMVRHLTSSGHGVDVVVGVAGAGKTRALDAARAIWEARSHHVIGAALAARAAAELREAARMHASTVHALLEELANPAGGRLPPRSVIVVDEAAMVGTRKLAELLARADAADAKVVLVGDDRQLPEIGAGGAFRALADRLPAIVMSENRRQSDATDRQALACLRAGQAAEAVDRLVARGRVTLAPHEAAARDQMVADWLAAHGQRHDVIMLAPHRVDVADLNHRARGTLRASGELPQDGLEAAGRGYATGERVMALHNRRRLDVHNGDRATITAIDSRHRSITIRLDRGDTVTLPANYLDAGHLGYGYASTIHKAQGPTCDRALLLGTDGLFQEAGYTGLSRGRDENRLYLVADPRAEYLEGHGPEPASKDAIAELTRALRHSRAKRLATEFSPVIEGLMTQPPTPELGRGIDL